MSQVDRAQVLKKLKGYLSREYSRQEVYEWALSQATRGEFIEVARADELLRETMQALIDMNHDDVDIIPTMADLNYYRACLEGNTEFQPREERLKPKKKSAAVRTPDPDIILAFRIYVIIFAVCSLLLHFIGILNPSFLRLSTVFPSKIDAFISSLPHIVYALVLLMPVRWQAKGTFYFVCLGLFSWGVLYYWFISIKLILGLAINVLVVLVILPFGGIPAMTALWLLLYEKIFRTRNITLPLMRRQ